MWRPMVRTIQQRQKRRLSSLPTMQQVLATSPSSSSSRLKARCFSTSSTASTTPLSHERGMILAGVAGAIVSTTIYFVTDKKPSSSSSSKPSTAIEETTSSSQESLIVDSELSSAKTDGNQEGENEEDPYDNLPEEDEETDCSMCQTFRKGPCRPYWRKLERCLKDHESSENVGAACLKYFTPHSSCLLQYTNLYHLISLHHKQELVNDAELAVRTHERRCWVDTPTNTMIQIDWKPWIELYQQTGPSFQQTIPRQSKTPSTGMGTDTTSKEEPIPLWQRLPENTEPVLVATKTRMPSIQEDMMLKIAYAVDQDGMVLGLSYNKAYGDLMEQTREQTKIDDKDETSASASTAETNPSDAINSSESSLPIARNVKTTETDKSESRPHDDDEASNNENIQTTNNNTYELEFYIFPGETKSVQICAMYSENPVQAPAEKRILDVLLYKSRSYDLEALRHPSLNR